MLTKIMKWVCIAALLLAALWRSSVSSQLVLQLVVCAGAILVALQAVRAGKYPWAAGFLAIAVLFNPVVPVALSGKIFVLLDWACLAAFLVLLAVLRGQLTLSMPPIINRIPRSASLPPWTDA